MAGAISVDVYWQVGCTVFSPTKGCCHYCVCRVRLGMLQCSTRHNINYFIRNFAYTLWFRIAARSGVGMMLQIFFEGGRVRGRRSVGGGVVSKMVEKSLNKELVK